MNKHQRIEKALRNTASRPLTNEMLTAAQTRSWQAISEKLEVSTDQHKLMYFLNPVFVKNMMPVMVSVITLVLIVGISFALFQPAGQQPTVVTTINQKSPATTDTPPDKTSSKNQTITTTSTYTNNDLGFTIEFPGEITSSSISTDRLGFTLRESLTLKNKDQLIANVLVSTAPNSRKQVIEDWLDQEKIKGERTIISYGNYNGVLIKPAKVSSLWNHFRAYAASSTNEDFYTTKNGEILNVHLQDISNSAYLDVINSSFKTYKRSPLEILKNDFASVTYDNKLFIFGGFKFTPDNTQTNGYKSEMIREVQVYNPSLDQWSMLTDIPNSYPLLTNPLGVQIGDHAYIIPKTLNHDGNNIITIWVYDLKNDKWSERISSYTGFIKHFEGFTLGARDNLYIIGGSKNNQATKDTHIYDIKNNTWAAGPPLNVGRARAESINYQEKLFVMQGDTGNLTGEPTQRAAAWSHLTHTIEYLDKNNNWVQLNDFSDSKVFRIHPAATATNLYLFALRDRSNLQDTVLNPENKFTAFQYNIAKDSWRNFDPGLNTTSVFAAHGLDKSIFVIGYSQGKTTVEEFVPDQ